MVELSGHKCWGDLPFWRFYTSWPFQPPQPPLTQSPLPVASECWQLSHPLLFCFPLSLLRNLCHSIGPTHIIQNILSPRPQRASLSPSAASSSACSLTIYRFWGLDTSLLHPVASKDLHLTHVPNIWTVALLYQRRPQHPLSISGARRSPVPPESHTSTRICKDSE